MSKKLYKVHNEIGVYWIIAENAGDAESKLKKTLDEADHGLFTKRPATVIEIIAEEVNKVYMTGKFLIL